jgi:hypothetical protein
MSSATLASRTTATSRDGCLKAILVAIVVLQRFAISFGELSIPVVLPVVVLLLVVGYVREEFALDPTRTQLVGVLLVTALACTLAQVAMGSPPSLASLILVVAIHIGMALRSTAGPEAFASVGRLFVAMMTGGAIVGLAQFAAQYAGIPNVDYIAEVVPDQFLVQGFSQNAFITYGSELRRSNGILFLEPSFLSLFLGLAVVIAARLGVGWVQMTVLVAGLVPPLAGSGLVVAIPGVLILAFSRYRRGLLALVPGALVGIAVAALTPLGALYLNRSSEAGADNSSASFRFVQPYSTLLPASMDSPFHALFGHGAGASDAYLGALNLAEITRPIIPKVLFEYGMLGAVGIVAVLVVLLGSGLRERPWMIGFVVCYFFINASFLVSTLALFTYFWMALVPPPVETAPSVVTAGRRARFEQDRRLVS